MLGSVGDCLTLIEILEENLQKHPQLLLACVAFVKDWRKQKFLRLVSLFVCDVVDILKLLCVLLIRSRAF